MKEKSENIYVSKLKTAAEFDDVTTEWLWKPYLPVGDYTVLISAGGTGKSILTCGIAAGITTGTKLPGMEEARPGQDVLFISSEDSGELYKQRLKASGADLNRIHILDCNDSLGFGLTDEDFKDLITETNAKLIVIDPWHAFCGEDININRVNCVRPLFQRIAKIAKECQCSILLISHVNKRSQDENANNAAMGSVDLINAARSALRFVFDDSDEDGRILVHTKSNYAKAGKSLKIRITEDGGMVWNGTSDVSRAVLEEAAAHHKKPSDILVDLVKLDEYKEPLYQAIVEICNQDSKGMVNIAYDQLRDLYGMDIFGGNSRPKQAIDAIKQELAEAGLFYSLKKVKYNGRSVNGIRVVKKNMDC